MNNKPFDLLVFDTKQEIVNILNTSGLPITVMGYILKDLLSEISQQEIVAINKQRKEFIKLQNGQPQESITDKKEG